MFVYKSNRTEHLVDVLADVVSEPLSSVLRCETIVVQSRGMERWLSMALANRLGVWANAAFPFPRRFLHDMFELVLEEPLPVANREHLTFRVAAQLDALAAQHPLLENYLRTPDIENPSPEAPVDDLRRVQLAWHIANTFDQYTVFRPDLIQQWQAGSSNDWQAELWRRSTEGVQHLHGRANDFALRLQRARGLPQRVCLFGITTLPPLYLSLFDALSRVIDVHLFLLSPSPSYWADLRTEKDIDRAVRKGAAAEDFDGGHPLLTGMGRVGKELQLILEDRSDYQEPRPNLFVAPEGVGLLHQLQRDILQASSEVTPSFSAADSTLGIHACYSALRQVEVLRGVLLDLLESDPTLQPRDVVVMAPDLQGMAPFIDAVFGLAPDAPGALPYRVADRPASAANPAAAAFLEVLDVLSGRLPAARVLDLLNLEPFRDRFEILDPELDIVTDWVRSSGIRWGADEVHRAESGQPPRRENTWKFGLHRLLMGCALPREATWNGVVPLDDIEGESVELVGRFAAMVNTLVSYRARFQPPAPLAQWATLLNGLLDATILVSEERANEVQAMRDAIAELAELAETAGYHHQTTNATIRWWLTSRFADRRSQRAFLSGGITFCATLPMRSIPFRVVCMLGLDANRFPRVQRTPSFDHMTEDRRVGDRSLRDDDRYLFLEAVLCARDHLVITYTGRSIRDNTLLPPSVVVSELLDALDPMFAGGHSATHVVTEHPLKPFDPAYFDGGNPSLFSYEAGHLATARSVNQVTSVAEGFAAQPLSPLPDDPILLDQLVDFFVNPSRALLRNRVGIELGQRAESLDDREPFELEDLARHVVGDHLLERILSGMDLDEAIQAAFGEGGLPIGTPGEMAIDDLRPSVIELATTVQLAKLAPLLAPLRVDLQVADRSVQGWLCDIREPGLVQWQSGQIQARHLVRLWIRHLALNLVEPDTELRTSTLIGRGKGKRPVGQVTFKPVDNAGQILGELVRLYELGMRMPLPFFPEAALAYTRLVCPWAGGAGDTHPKEARDAAKKKHEYSLLASDPYVGLAFEGVKLFWYRRGPLWPALPELPDFERASVTIIEPMLHAMVF